MYSILKPYIMTTATKFKNITITTEQIEKIEHIIHQLNEVKYSVINISDLDQRFKVENHSEALEQLTLCVKYAKLNDLKEVIFYLKYSTLLLTYIHSILQGSNLPSAQNLMTLIQNQIKILDRIRLEVCAPIITTKE
jgi:hypothetical protein